MDDDDRNDGRARLDKWLWAARFFKTRSLAAQAIDGGRVKLNGARVKPSRELKPGDALEIQAGELTWTVTVTGVSVRRGPAAVARTLYDELPESVAKREAALAARRERPEPALGLHGRPTKRDRRQIRRFTDGG
jgi:ribosome-associated heat shock protein Hsp15